MDRVAPWMRVRVVLDRLVAAWLSVVTAPAVVVMALLVRRDDGGAGLIQVPRVGADGRTFGMWKVRTMRAEREDGRASGAALTSSADRRITPIGSRLRRFHLDELPQLYNVVRGEMCLLGPRPEAPEYVDANDPAWRHALSVPPGIAGPTQLIVDEWERISIDHDVDGTSYRDVVVPVKLAIDRWYVARSSPRVDLVVCRALAARLLGRDRGPGETGLEREIRRRVPAAAAPLAHRPGREATG